jgi:chemotaxis protein methyltransferase CheR
MINDEVLMFFARWIEKEMGVIYEKHNLYQLKDRLENLTKQLELGSTTELWQKAQEGITGNFRTKLIDISTNNETSFFRDTKVFACLEKTVFPKLIQQAGDLSKLNIWSVACSTGQEPYSMAMILNQFGKKLNSLPPKIFATDISNRAMERAILGKFSDLEVGRGLPIDLKQKFFKQDMNGQWDLSSEIKSTVQFQHLNLRQNFTVPSKFDLVLCRNVLIYQKVEAKADIIKRIAANMRPGGILIMGSGESLIGLSTEFDQTMTDEVAIYSRKATAVKAAA